MLTLWDLLSRKPCDLLEEAILFLHFPENVGGADDGVMVLAMVVAAVMVTIVMVSIVMMVVVVVTVIEKMAMVQ